MTETAAANRALQIFAQTQTDEQFAELRQQLLRAFHETLPKGAER